MKKHFSLIELIMVIAILGILTALAIPNINNFKGDATKTAIVSDTKNLQTGVDMYQLKNFGIYPVIGENQPSLGQPKQIDFNKLYPKYIRTIPKHDTVYYWIDYQGKVWYSTVDSPTDITLNDTNITWDYNPSVDKYFVYEINDNQTSGAAIHQKKLKIVDTVEKVGVSTPADYSKTKTYLVSAVDENNFESAPVDKNYIGFKLPNNTLETPTDTIKVNTKPVAVISMTPEQGLTTNTTIVWDYNNSTDVDGDTITNSEWQGKQDVYTTEGTYTVSLRVQDEQGLWSDWVHKEFYVINSKGITQIATGSTHTVVLLNDGTVKAWGSNNLGQLGDGTTINKTIPITIPNLINVSQISVGTSYTVALLNDGTVKSWGTNDYGQLGDGTTTNKLIPTEISNLNNVKQVVAGMYHTVALLNDGTVKAWGCNNFGQLGDGTTTNKFTPIEIPNLNNVKQIATGGYYTISLLEDGTVKAWGQNNSGQLGDGTTTNSTSQILVSNLNNVKQVLGGYNHTVALLNDGTVKTWGSNANGELGLGDATILKKLTPTTVPNLNTVKQIAIGSYHTIALLDDETVKTWGLNTNGQLGDGTPVNRNSPIIVPNLNNVKQIVAGGQQSAVLLNNNEIMTWGKKQFTPLTINIY